MSIFNVYRCLSENYCVREWDVDGKTTEWTETNAVNFRVYFCLCLREQSSYSETYLEVHVALPSTPVSFYQAASVFTDRVSVTQCGKVEQITDARFTVWRQSG